MSKKNTLLKCRRINSQKWASTVGIVIVCHSSQRESTKIMWQLSWDIVHPTQQTQEWRCLTETLVCCEASRCVGALGCRGRYQPVVVEVLMCP